MNNENDIAAALAGFKPIGDSRAEELGEYVIGHVRSRPAPARATPDPDVVAGLRELGQQTELLSPVIESFVPTNPISVMVDFNELYEQLGEPEIWSVLGKLKDLFDGGS